MNIEELSNYISEKLNILNEIIQGFEKNSRIDYRYDLTDEVISTLEKELLEINKEEQEVLKKRKLYPLVPLDEIISPEKQC